MSTLRGLGADQRVHTVNSERLDVATRHVTRSIRNRVGRDGYIPSLNHFRGAKAQIANGVWRLLNMPLTINGITPRPLTFVGQRITAAGAPEQHGDVTLALQAGTLPDFQQPGAFRDGLGFLRCNAGGYLKDTTGDHVFADIAAQDFVVELAIIMGGDSLHIADKRSVGVGGWEVKTGAGVVNCSISDGTAVQFGSGAITAGALTHLFGVADRSGSGVWHVNGDMKTPAVISGSAGSLTRALSFALGARSAGGTPWDEAIYLFQLWIGPDAVWLDGHNQIAIAKQRSAALYGWLPLSSKGSDVPNTMARASSIHSYRYIAGERRIFELGANAMPWDEVGVDDGTGISAHGPRSEPLGTNEVLQSSTLATTWTARGTCTPTNNTGETTDPWGGNNATLIEDCGTVGVDDIFQLVTGFTIDAILAAGLWVKRKSTTSSLVIKNPITSANGQWVVPMSGLPDRWVRITRNSPYISGGAIEFVADGAGSAGVQFRGGGAGAVDFYVANVQQEENGSREVSSDIGPTTTGAVTRLADNFEAPAGDNIGGEDNQKGTIVSKFVVNESTSAKYLVAISDGGSVNDNISLIVTGSTGTITYLIKTGSVTQVNAIGSVDSADGAEHEIRATWESGRAQARLDGIATTAADPSVDPPINLDEAHHGQRSVNTLQLGGFTPILRFLAQPSLKG